jgi:glycosyltransferase involved in cell wall biosynthesis
MEFLMSLKTADALGRKFGAIYCVYEHHAYLEISAVPLQKYLDHTVFLVSDVPWYGRPADTSSAIEKIKKLCSQHPAIELITGHWVTEAEQRNYGLEYLFKKGIDYAFIIDGDEIYHEREFERIREFIIGHQQYDVFHIENNTYWKDFYRIDPRESFLPAVAVKTGKFKFTKGREGITESQFSDTNQRYNWIQIPGNIARCYHLSYVRSDEELKRKIDTFSHAPEIICGWYENVWLRWTPEMENIHPVDPPQYKKAIWEDISYLPIQLVRFIKQKRHDNRLCSIILVNYNSCALLKRCLENIAANTKNRIHEIIVVDNGSTKDDSIEFIKSLDCRKVLNDNNLGYAGGVNHGLKLAKDSDVCLLNVDAEVRENWLSEMYSTMTRYSDCGIVGPLGNIVEGGFQAAGSVREDTKVFGLFGFCMLIAREVIDRIGYFDTRFGIGGFEDVDYCLRAHLAGFSSFISAKSLVIHKAHQVFEINGLNYLRDIDSPHQDLYMKKLVNVIWNLGSIVDAFSDPVLAEKLSLKINYTGAPFSGNGDPIDLALKISSGKTTISTPLIGKKCKIIFCVTGQFFSERFLWHWSQFLQWCGLNGIDYGCAIVYDPIVFNARNRCLQGSYEKGKNQKPFQGLIDYDYILWIDSDIIFDPEQFERLLAHQKGIVSGLYLMENAKEYATASPFQTEEPGKTKRFAHLTPADVKNKTELISVPYTGFGFMLIKKGVFESLEYPWFRPIYSDLDGMQFFSPEDAGFCQMAKKKGFEIFVDPTVIVGHEKRFVLKE